MNLQKSGCALLFIVGLVHWPSAASAAGLPTRSPLAMDAAAPQSTDYPGAVWSPAAVGNYQVSNRPISGPIDQVVIHDIEGSAEGAVLWFQNPEAKVSAHYVVSSTDGKVYQLVREKDIAWHAGNATVNRRSIGIEHEGFAYRPGFYNPQEYEASARLVRSITTRYGIPRDREHIIAHAEVPNPFHAGEYGGSSGHTDPGPYWDWNSFMTLVRSDARLDAQMFPAVIHPGELLAASATFTNTGDDPWINSLKDSAYRRQTFEPAPAISSPGAELKTGQGAAGRQGADLTVERAVVYLGVWSKDGHGSPFFNYEGWTSPQFAAHADADASPGSPARFRFQLLGPRALGLIREHFRVESVPVAPNVPVAFGDVLSCAIQVRPWDIVLTTADPGFSAPGWNVNGRVVWRKTESGSKSSSPKAAGSTAPATWAAPLPISGGWDVYARWMPGRTHSRKGFYQVIAMDGSHVIPVDQRVGRDWRKLGRFNFGDHQPVIVRLSAVGAPGAVIADAIRVVGPFPTALNQR